MATISIDTADNQNLVVSLEIKEKKDSIDSNGKSVKSQVVLPYIDTLLKRNKVNLGDIKGITVATGPGSFTGLRVGVAIANALSFFLEVSLNGKKVGELEEAKYN